MPVYRGTTLRLRRAYESALAEYLARRDGVEFTDISVKTIRQMLGHLPESEAGRREMQRVPELAALSPSQLKNLLREDAHANFLYLGSWNLRYGY